MAIPKAPTGIVGFDEITYGGLPAAGTTLVVGGAGTGKTIFALQALVNGARGLHDPAIFVAFEEPADQIVKNASSFGWDLEELQRERLFFLDARLSPVTVKAGEFDLEGILAGLDAKAKELKAKRIVFDGLDVLLTLLNDPNLERREAYRLHEWLKKSGMTGIITAKSIDRERVNVDRYQFMQFMVDCVVGLQHRLSERVSLRSMRVLKYRGSGFDEGEFPYVIADDGIDISTFKTDQLDVAVSNERVSTGVERLDRMLNGGYYRGSGVIVTGMPGTSKTTLVGAFAERMCEQGEKVLYVSFDEASAQIARNLKSVGIELDPWLNQDQLHIHSIRTEARSAEEHLMEIRKLIRDFQPRHLVIDPISALAKTGGHVSAVHASMRLLDYAKCRGITTLCTSLVNSSDISEESTDTEISTIADTWIHLAYKVLGGERNRTLTIVKARGIGHSNQVRELILSNDGITLADVYSAGGEVLVGTARFEREAAIRLTQQRRELEIGLRRAELKASESELRARAEIVQRELEAKRAEIALFETSEATEVEEEHTARSTVQRLRGADRVNG
jgi:circadian clock protein KaiC